MYERFYGLQERPFDLSPNPRFLCFTAQHREALAHLEYGLAGRPGITVIVGEAGTGKTTLVRKALQVSTGEVDRRPLVESDADPRRVLRIPGGWIRIQRRGWKVEDPFSARAGRRTWMTSPSRGWRWSSMRRKACPYELLEEIRLLTNAESATGRSIAVALVGQPELARRLDEVRLRQLKQRVVLRCALTPLSLKDTAAYITGRVKTAGGEAMRLFTRDAVIAIHKHSKGIPRVISVICDNALVNGFAADQKPVGASIVGEVCRSLALTPEETHAEAAGSTAGGRAGPAAAAAPMFADVGRRRFSFF